MVKAVIGAIAVSAMLGTTASLAATLVNKDKSTYKIVVVEGDARKEFSVVSGQELTGLCSSSCSIYVGSDPEPYDLAAQDKTEIYEGELYRQLPPEQQSNKQ